MPMTAAHPLAVLPFRWLRLDTTCLVIGSMSPDFEYFLRVRLTSTVSHTLPGLVWFCLPITLIAAVLFHRVLKWPAVRVAPAWLGRRLAGYAQRPWMPRWTPSAVAVLIVSALIGATTHWLWDGVTHGDGWAPHRYAFLYKMVTLPVLGYIIMHRAIQHISTVIGLVILAIVLGRALARARPVPLPAPSTRDRLIWLASIALVTALSFVRVLGLELRDPGSVIVAIIAGFLGGALVASLLTQSTLNEPTNRSPSPR